jgi:hypothetical protein
MKLIFSSANSSEVGLAQSQLEAAGIECEIRNDAISQALPALPFASELWVLQDGDYEDACEIIGHRAYHPQPA